MKRIEKSKLSNDECWSVQVNGLSFCESCKFTGLTACFGNNIRLTGKNNKGYTIGKNGIES